MKLDRSTWWSYGNDDYDDDLMVFSPNRGGEGSHGGAQRRHREGNDFRRAHRAYSHRQSQLNYYIRCLRDTQVLSIIRRGLCSQTYARLFIYRSILTKEESEREKNATRQSVAAKNRLYALVRALIISRADDPIRANSPMDCVFGQQHSN
ncbi:hypothetical protein TWF132_007086 [Orbilia oligospora]|nr:hypothetical protein TWF132_007086 [Orbilia oligospora]